LNRLAQVDAYGSVPDGSPADARLDRLLENWAAWMGSERYGKGYPPRSPGLRSSSAQTFDAAVREVDVRLARAVDAAVDSLQPNQRIAICLRYGLTLSVWRLRQPLDEAEAEARVAIREALARRRVE
jgi:hypothetical protein